jgi:Ca2+-binding RTX toxin-like protein
MTTPTKWGAEILVPTTNTARQYGAKTAAFPDGRFIVVWTDESRTGGDTSDSATRGQFFNADGSKSGSEFLINDITAGAQNSVTVATTPEGRVLLTYTTQSFPGEADIGIVGSTLDAQNGEFLINTTTAGAQEHSAVAGFASEQFVVTWTDANSADIKAQLLNAYGAKVGGEISVNSMTAGSQGSSSVATFESGNFVVAWQDNAGSAEDPSAAVRARLFSPTGAALTQDFLVNTTTLATQSAPMVTALAGGRFVVTWTDFSQSGADTSGHAVRAQIFNNDGSRAGSEFLVNTTTDGDQSGSFVAALPDGRFVAVWCHGTGSAADVRGQVFTSEGAKSGVEFTVNAPNGLEQLPSSITVLADGRFVVSFTEGASDSDVHAQIFDSRETRVTLYGTEFRDHYFGTRFADILEGADDFDTLIGGDGNDTLVGGKGADILDGGNDHDVASYLGSTAGVSIDLNAGTASGGDAVGDTLTSIEDLHGSGYDDVLIGNSANNNLQAFFGNDRLEGREGNDSLVGGEGGDILDGGAGIDSVRYSTSSAAVDVDLSTGLGAGGDAAGDVLSGIEWVFGSAYGDHLHGDDGDNLLNGSDGNDDVEGGGGNDTLYGGPGADALNGGDGDDTAVFEKNFDQYQIARGNHGLIGVNTATSLESVVGIEHLQFQDFQIDVDDGILLFDTLYYLSANSDVYHAGVDALAHFNQFGWREGRDPNEFFDTSSYLAVNRDVAAAGINPLDHYHQVGWREGRDPSADFDTTLYLLNNPDVAAAGMDPLLHYLEFGMKEGRDTYNAVGHVVNGFDAQHYLFQSPDVAAAGIDPLFHFNTVGWREGRDPNNWFDTSGYLAHYADVAAAGINPFDHYMAVGWKEGRDASTYFDTYGYLVDNPDVAAAGINPLDHFLQSGIYEGRQAVNDGMWS